MSNSKPATRTATSSDRLDMDISQFNKLNANEKIIVKLLSSKIDDITKRFEIELQKRDEKIHDLEAEIKVCKSSYEKLENRFDDQEATSRGDSLIISGNDIPSVNGSENCSGVVHNLMRNKLKLSISEENIYSAHRIGKPPTSQKPDKRNILVKMKSEEIVQEVVRCSKKIRPNSLFFSENFIARFCCYQCSAVFITGKFELNFWI